MTVAPIVLMKPGQVLVLSQKTIGAELDRYKADAKQAQQNLDKMMQEDGFDPDFFAQNYELFYEAVNDVAYSGVTSAPVPSPDGMISAATMGVVANKTVSGVFTFYEQANRQVLGSYSKLLMQMNVEKQNGTRLANPKHYSEFKRKYPDIVRDFDNKISRNMFTLNSGIQTPNMRRHIQNTAFIRGKNYKGGLDGYVKNMEQAGNISKKVKLGGNLLIAWDVVDAGNAIYSAHQTGDSDHFRRTAIVEPLKVSGSLVGGRFGVAGGLATGTYIATVVLGVGTGGIGLIVVGVCVVAGGLAGGYLGGKGAGWVGGKV